MEESKQSSLQKRIHTSSRLQDEQLHSKGISIELVDFDIMLKSGCSSFEGSLKELRWAGKRYGEN